MSGRGVPRRARQRHLRLEAPLRSTCAENGILRLAHAKYVPAENTDYNVRVYAAGLFSEGGEVMKLHIIAGSLTIPITVF